MTNNINKISATEQFQNDIKTAMENYYKKAISENVKRALENKKKLSTISKVAM